MQMQSNESDDLQVQAIVKQLNSNKKEDRAEGERRLKLLGPESVPSLLAILAEERTERNRNVKRMRAIFIPIFIGIVAVAILTHRLPFITVMIIVIVGMCAATQAQKSIAKTLAQFADIRTVGALAEALEYQDKDITQAAAATLTNLLPRMQASDAEHLDAEQRKCLCRALHSNNNPALVCAVLKAFEQFGGEEAIHPVQRLVDGHDLAASNSLVRTTAQECLPFLLRRAKHEQLRHTLLRTVAPDESVFDQRQ